MNLTEENLSDRKCVICGEIIVSHRNRRASHKTCRNQECKKAYRKQYIYQYEKNQRLLNLQDGTEVVTCAICGDRFKFLQHTHLRIHGLTVAQYKEQFPLAPLMTNKMKELLGRGSLVQSRYLNYAGKEPDNYLFEFLTGALLGDGSLEKCTGKLNARYVEGGKNELYLKWKHDLVLQYFPCSWKERISSPHTKTGKRYLGWWLRTTVHPLLTEWHSQWYQEGKKIVPQPLLEKYLTEFALAVWFCDDGHSSKREERSYLYTMAFLQEEVVFLSELLLSRFGLKNNILNNKQGQQFLAFSATSSNMLREITGSFSIPGMAYKSQKPIKNKSRSKKNEQLVI